MNTQMAQNVIGNGGLYNGSSTSKHDQMNTQMAQTVMENGWLYNGNSTSSRPKQRIDQVIQRLLSTTGTRKRATTTTDPLVGVRKSNDSG